MEMRIIGAVLSIVLVYLVLAVLTSHLSELLAGLRNARGRVFEEMIDSVFADNAGLVKAFYDYPPIKALAPDSGVRSWFGPGTPAALPPNLIAQGYLAVLNTLTAPAGKSMSPRPPRTDFQTPGDFVSALEQVGGANGAASVLLMHKADAGTDWDAFQANVAQWIADVGDRADGWFKRSKSMGILGVAALLVFMADADTSFMVHTFLQVDEQRGSFSNVAELVNAQHSGQKPDDAKAPPLKPAASRTQRLSQASDNFVAAMADLRAALKDPGVQSAGLDRDDVYASCGSRLTLRRGEATGAPVRNEEWFASNSDAWMVLLPEIIRRTNDANYGVTLTSEPSDAIRSLSIPDGAGLKMDASVAPDSMRLSAKITPPPASAAASDAGAWSWSRFLRAFAPSGSPVGQRAAANGRAGGARATGDAEREGELSGVMACVNVVHAWVAAAHGQGHSDAANKNLGAAKDELEKGRMQLREELLASAATASLPRRLLADHEQFEACVDQAGSSRGDFDNCLDRAAQSRLPFGWQNLYAQVCVGHVDRRPLAGAPASGFCPRLDANEALQIPRIESDFSVAGLLTMVGGLLFSMFMVSLGAPFWWGVLGKVADLRLAGGVRGLDDSSTVDTTKRPPPVDGGPGSPPPPPPADGSGGSPGPATDAASDGGIIGARNLFERSLRVQDVTRVQKAVKVPTTGQLDELTRDGISRFLVQNGQPAERELTPVNYQTITGRPPATVVAPNASAQGPWKVGDTVPTALLGPLQQALDAQFPSTGHWPLVAAGAGGTYPDDLCARVVLYLARSDSKPYKDKDVATRSRAKDATLRVLDDALRKRILADKSVFQRETTAPWIDFAVGELGVFNGTQVGQGNLPRVDEYLTGFGQQQAQINWCGAFVGWVLDRQGLLTPSNLGGLQLQALLLSLNWQQFGKPVVVGAEQLGDICVFRDQADPTHGHVGFWLAQDAGGIWLLGGNQGGNGTGAGGVMIEHFKLTGPLNYLSAVRP
jgi:hypothetical protein